MRGPMARLVGSRRRPSCRTQGSVATSLPLRGQRQSNTLQPHAANMHALVECDDERYSTTTEFMWALLVQVMFLIITQMC